MDKDGEEELFEKLESEVWHGPVQLLVTWNSEAEEISVEQIAGEIMTDFSLIGILELAKMYFASPFFHSFMEAHEIDEDEDD